MKCVPSSFLTHCLLVTARTPEKKQHNLYMLGDVALFVPKVSPSQGCTALPGATSASPMPVEIQGLYFCSTENLFIYWFWLLGVALITSLSLGEEKTSGSHVVGFFLMFSDASEGLQQILPLQCMGCITAFCGLPRRELLNVFMIDVIKTLH